MIMTEFEKDWNQDPMDTYPNRHHQSVKTTDEEFKSSLKAIMYWMVLIALILLSIYINDQIHVALIN